MDKVSDPSLTRTGRRMGPCDFDSDSSSEVYRDTLAAGLVEHYQYSIFDQSSASRKYRTPTAELVAQLSEARDLLAGLVEELPNNKDYASRLVDVEAIHDQAIASIGELAQTKHALQSNRSPAARRLVAISPDTLAYQAQLAKYLTQRAVFLFGSIFCRGG